MKIKSLLTKLCVGILGISLFCGLASLPPSSQPYVGIVAGSAAYIETLPNGNICLTGGADVISNFGGGCQSIDFQVAYDQNGGMQAVGSAVTTYTSSVVWITFVLTQTGTNPDGTISYAGTWVITGGSGIFANYLGSSGVITEGTMSQPIPLGVVFSHLFFGTLNYQAPPTPD